MSPGRPEGVTRDLVQAVVRETFTYTYACKLPMALPSTLLELPEDIISDIVVGRTLVRSSFNWPAFGRIVDELGYSLEWEKPSEDDRANKEVVIVTYGVPVVRAKTHVP